MCEEAAEGSEEVDGRPEVDGADMVCERITFVGAVVAWRSVERGARAGACNDSQLFGLEWAAQKAQRVRSVVRAAAGGDDEPGHV